jgi:hypothetical protein
MRKLLRLQFALLSAAIFTALLTVPVFAGIGVSPADVTNLQLKQGATFKQEIIISQSDPNEDLTVNLEADVPGINDWFSFEPSATFTLPKGQQHFTTTVIVKVPQNADLKTYSGAVRLKASPANATQGGVAVVKGARLDVKLGVTDKDITDFVVRSLTIEDFVVRTPLILKLKVENAGNIASAPTKVTISVTDLNNKPVDSLEGTEGLDPIGVGETKELSVKVANTLSPGEYFGDVKIWSQDKVLREEKINFKVKIPEAAPAASLSSLSPEQQLLVIIVGVIVVSVIVLLLTLFTIHRITYFSPHRKYILQIVAFVIFLVIDVLTILGVLTQYNQNLPQTQEVKGVTTINQQSTSSSTPTPVNTSTNLVPHEFKIYAAPDTTSPVVYVAKENEQLKVLEENSWGYKVILPNGANGWLPKGDVKAKQTIEK